MRLLPPLPPPTKLLLVLLSLLVLTPSVLSQPADDTYNSSAASFVSLPPSFHSALSVLVRVCSSFSLLFSVFVVAAFFLVPRLRNEYNARFVLLLACSDMLYSILLLLGPLSASSSSLVFPASPTPSTWCAAHSSLLLYASLVSLCWTSVIAVNHFLVVYHAASILQLRRYQLIQHISAWLLPLLPVLLLLLLPSSDAALASPLCWFGMADARLAYPSSSWLLLLPQLLGCSLVSCCYMLALRYGRRLTSQVVKQPASGTQTKEASLVGVSGSTTYQKAGGSATAPSDRAVLSDKYRQMRLKVGRYLLCAFLLTLPLLLSSLSLLPSASLSAPYLSFLFLLQAVVSSSVGILHSCAYGWNLRLFYHLCPPAAHPPLLTALLCALHLPPPPPAMSPATSPPFAYTSRIHPSVLGGPVVSPHMSSRVVSTIGRHSWRTSTVMMTQLPGYSNRLPLQRVDGTTHATSRGSGSEDDDSGSAGSLQATPVLANGVLLSPPAVDAAEVRLAADGISDSASPLVSRNATPSVGLISGSRRFSVTNSIGLPPALAEGGSFSVPHPNSSTASPVLSAQSELLPQHLQPLTSFSSLSNPQSALPWIPSLSLPPHHALALPAVAASGLAPVRVLRAGSSFSSSSRASVSFLSPTHQSQLTPRSDGGSGEAVDGSGGSGMRVLVSGWDGPSGLTARRSSQEDMKELETLNEEDERDGEDNNTSHATTAAHRPSLHSQHTSHTKPSPLLSPSSASASTPCTASTELSRGSIILSPRPVPSPSAGANSRSLSPSASNCHTPPSHHSTGSRYSFSLASFGRTSISSPSSSRSSPNLAARVVPAGYSPRPSTTLDRRPLRVNPAPPTTASAAVSPRSEAVVRVDVSGSDGGLGVAVVVEVEAVGLKRPKLMNRQSLPITVAAMSAELRTGASAGHRLAMRRQSEPAVTQ